MISLVAGCAQVSESELARYPRVADALRELRQACRMTQEQTAHAVNLTLSGYRTYEQGKRNLTYSQVEEFAHAFGVPVSAITSRLWPDDPVLTGAHQASEWTDIQAMVDRLAPDQRERVIRSFQQIAEIAGGVTESDEVLLARIDHTTDDAGVRAHLYRDLKPRSQAARDEILQGLPEHHPNLRKSRTGQ